MTGYPPSPWLLRGRLDVSVWLPRTPDVAVPPGWRLVRVAGRAVAGTAFVDYRPGGVLHYRELLAAVLVRRGGRIRPCVTHIWVDSPASRDGGRALWGIPKELAAFDARPGGTRADADDGPIAAAGTGTVLGLPGRWPAPLAVVQERDGAALVSPVRCTGRVVLTVARWWFAPDGPLAFLRGHRPLLSLRLEDFRMRFGR